MYAKFVKESCFSVSKVIIVDLAPFGSSWVCALVCACLSMCVCVYACVCVCVCVCCKHSVSSVWMRVCVCACVFMRACVCMCLLTHCCPPKEKRSIWHFCWFSLFCRKILNKQCSFMWYIQFSEKNLGTPFFPNPQTQYLQSTSTFPKEKSSIYTASLATRQTNYL